MRPAAPGEARLLLANSVSEGGRLSLVHVGLDLSRTRLDVHMMDEAGTSLAVTTAVPDRDGLAVLAERIGGFGDRVGVRGDRVDERCSDDLAEGEMQQHNRASANHRGRSDQTCSAPGC
jgi:hypothetical protein